MRDQADEIDKVNVQIKAVTALIEMSTTGLIKKNMGNSVEIEPKIQIPDHSNELLDQTRI